MSERGREIMDGPESPVSTRSEGVDVEALGRIVDEQDRILKGVAEALNSDSPLRFSDLPRAVAELAALSAPVLDVAATLRRLAKDAYERGDIGKDGGVEAWDYLNAHADKIEADGVPDVAAERVAACTCGPGAACSRADCKGTPLQDAPFDEVPSGLDIGHYFMEATDRRNPGCDGIDLYRDGLDYCYLWVEATIDHDRWVSYLLDVRTSVGAKKGEISETRDFLFVHAGAGGVFEVEWHNKPIPFEAPTDDHLDRLHDGWHWFVNRAEGAMERAEGQSRDRAAALTSEQSAALAGTDEPWTEDQQREFAQDWNDRYEAGRQKETE